MTYTAKDYSGLLGMVGFSETLLKNHFTLYQGYVTNTNKVLDTLDVMLKEGKTGTPEFAELKRRLGWEFNGMRLHEYYFENLGGSSRGTMESMEGALVFPATQFVAESEAMTYRSSWTPVGDTVYEVLSEAQVKDGWATMFKLTMKRTD